MDKKPLIVFDFDGTIADTFALTVDLFKKYATQYGFNSNDISTIELLRGMSASDAIKFLKIPIYKVPFFISSGLKEIRKNIEIILPINGIESALKSLQAEGYKMGILTSNSKENVNSFLLKNNLNYFDFIYSGTNIFGKSKLFSRLMREKKITNKDLIYVGDEVRDIDAAIKSKIKIVSVSWGFNSKEILEKNNPDFVISTPQDLLETIKRINN